MSISCPTCQKESILPDGSADKLSVDQVVIQLFDVRKELASESDSGSINEEVCPEHGETLKGYCEVCHKVICRDCTMSRKHNGHTYCLISECYSKHSLELETRLESVRMKISDMDGVVSGLETVELEVMKRGESIKDDIEAHAQQIMEQVQVSKENLFKEVDEFVSRKKTTISKQTMEASKILKNLQKCETKVTQSMSELTQAKVLMNKEQMMERMESACDIDHSVFKPIEHADMRFARNLSLLSDQDIGQFVSTSFSEAVLDQQVVEQTSTNTSIIDATLKFKAHDGGVFPLPSDILTCKLVSVSQTETCCVSKAGLGEYKIAVTLSSEGEHKLVVQAGGIEVPGSPFILSDKRLSSLQIEERTPVKSINRLSQPKGIAICDDGRIAVVETGAHCVTIMNSNGTVLDTYGERNTKKTFIHPRGVAIHKDRVMYVTDDHRLHKVDIIKKNVVKSVGKPSPGSGQIQLRNPHDIAVHPTSGLVFVADSGNNRIQVFKSDLSFLHTINNYQFNQPKISSGCFNEPIGVTFDCDNNLYVSEYLNHCITKITAKGQFIMKIGSEGSAPGNLYGPASITTHSNYIYVAEMGIDRVSVFDRQGTFVSGFWHRSQDMDSNTHGIAVNTEGRVHISDNMTSITIY